MSEDQNKLKREPHINHIFTVYYDGAVEKLFLLPDSQLHTESLENLRELRNDIFNIMNIMIDNIEENRTKNKLKEAGE